MELAWFLLLLACFNVLLTFSLIFSLKRAKNELAKVSSELIQGALNDVAPQITEAIQEGFTPMVKRATSIMAGKSAVSRQLKSAEREILAEGIDMATGIPGVGGMAAKYLQKYPALKMLLPMLLQGKGGSPVNPMLGGGSSNTRKNMRFEF